MDRQNAGRFATKEYEFKVNSLGHSDTVPAEAAALEQRAAEEERVLAAAQEEIGRIEAQIWSIDAGLREVSPQAELIAIHDGARPLLPPRVLEETVAQAARTGAAAPALPVTDTIKRIKDGVSTGTVDREDLRAVQTPQIFEAGLIRAALEKAIADGENLTDDCAAVERLGMPVTLTQGSRENIKITTPFDLLLGQAILENRVKGS